MHVLLKREYSYHKFIYFALKVATQWILDHTSLWKLLHLIELINNKLNIELI